MPDILRNRINLIIVPIIIAIIWAFMAYSTIVLGKFVQFSQYILPLSYILFATYFFGLFFWYKIEQTGYAKKIDMLEMDVHSLLDRVEIAESIVDEMKNKE